MKYKIFAILTIFVTLCAAGPLAAHHGLTAIFDTKKTTVTGTLTEVDWQNPHIVVVMESKKDDGSVEMWKFESNPPVWFKRLGITRNDFAKSIGKVVTVEGLRAKDGSPYGYLQKVTFSEGNSLELVDQNQH